MCVELIVYIISLKSPKQPSETLIRRTHNTIAKGKQRHTMADITVHINLKIILQKPHQDREDSRVSGA